jgi:hypothetical protein
MKTWTTKQRYATYDTYSKNELDRLQKLQRDSKWHLGISSTTQKWIDE